VPKYFSFRDAAQSLLEAIPAKQDHDLILFDIEKWVATQWRDGLLKITGRPLNNTYLGDRIEVEPHSDRDIHWHEGTGQEPRVYEREGPGRGTITGQWRGLEITAEDLARLKEHIQGLPKSESTPVTPTPLVALAEVAESEPEAAQPTPAVPAEAGGPAPVLTELPDQPGPKPGNETPLKARAVPIAIDILGAPDRPPNKRGWRAEVARRVHQALAAQQLNYQLESVARVLRNTKLAHPDHGTN